MFISNAEKQDMQISISMLKSQVDALIEEVKKLQLANVKIKRPKAVIVKTPEAPWGYTKQGIRRKRPGPRSKPEVQNEQPVSV